MAEVAQDAIDNAVTYILKDWKKRGFEIDGTRVKACPIAFKAAANAMKEFEGLIQPEYEVTERKVEPTHLSLTAIPPLAKGLVYAKINFEPEDYKNYSLDDYRLGAFFALRRKEFPSDIADTLGDIGVDSLDDEIRKTVMFKTAASGWGNGNCIVKDTVQDLKNCLRIALAVKEYDERHPKKCMEGSQ